MPPSSAVNSWKVFCLLFILILVIYANSFKAGWHLDDFENILRNGALHISELTPRALAATLFAEPTVDGSSNPKLYRPLACLTFGLNWYAGQNNVFGYHLVNVGIHLLTAFFLFTSILSLYRTPGMQKRTDGEAYFVALLAAVLWAINPIQTQAVTYIVQRMASMAAMFYIIGLFCYLRARQSNGKIRPAAYFSGAAGAFLCALASKENAITFPLALLLLEVIFFQDFTEKKNRRNWLGVFGGAALILMAMGVLFFLWGEPLKILNGYESRPFTLWQRLMTEPRVLCFYLSQLFYPVPTRLSIEHDIIYSTSLIRPWTTLPAILAVLSLFGLACRQMRRRPMLSFAILFFFLNHAVESSVLPLELIFEHRNYLPSMFLFVPVAIGLQWILDFYRAKQSALYPVLIAFIVLLVAGLGWGTHVRNMAWATEKSLWEDALKKAPGSMRPYTTLAASYYDKIGDHQTALRLYELALGKISPRKKEFTIVAMQNMGRIYHGQQRNGKAIEIWSEAVKGVKDHRLLRISLAQAYAATKDWEKALAEMDHLLAKWPDHPEYNYLRGIFLIKVQRFDNAIFHLRKALKGKYAPSKTLANIGIAYYLKQDFRKAERFIMWSAGNANKTPEYLLWLLAVNLKKKDNKDVDHYSEALVKAVSVFDLYSWFDQISKPDYYLYPDKNLIIAAVMEKFPQRPETSASF
jgi:tetratricopeptide (TPR) repeat protein